jgi:hypothetical protein
VTIPDEANPAQARHAITNRFFRLTGGNVCKFDRKIKVNKNGQFFWGESLLPLLVGIDIDTMD